MGIPTLVLIDLQKDFYAPTGSYARAGRPLAPIRRMIARLIPFCQNYPHIVRIRSLYRKNQFQDMPELCIPGKQGTLWHPQLRMGKLLTKTQHSGFSCLEASLPSTTPLVLAGVCTHRCIRKTLEDALVRDWNARVLEEGIASCGKRWQRHRQWLKRWENHNRSVAMETLLRKSSNHIQYREARRQCFRRQAGSA